MRPPNRAARNGPSRCGRNTQTSSTAKVIPGLRRVWRAVAEPHPIRLRRRSPLLFFDGRKPFLCPDRLGTRIRTGEPFARALHREADLVQQTRHALDVEAHAESVQDQTGHQLAGPHPDRQASRLWPTVDQRRKLVALGGAELRVAATAFCTGQPRRTLPREPPDPVAQLRTELWPTSSWTAMSAVRLPSM